jgi:periplasmic divalent cation tolerance protein
MEESEKTEGTSVNAGEAPAPIGMPAMSQSHVVIFVTVESQEQARRIADALLREKLVACANIVKGVESFFWWQGKVDRSDELMLVMKSREELVEDIVRLVKGNHSYEVPEVVALRIIGGNPDYLRWIDESVKNKPKGDGS